MSRIVALVVAVVFAFAVGGYVVAQNTGTATPGANACASPAAVMMGTPAAVPGTNGAVAPSPQVVSPCGSPAAQAGQYSVAMVDINFDPKQLTIPANTPVTVNLVNKGAAVHNFNIDALNVHSGDYQPGQTGTVTINAPAGTYQYYCNIPGHKEAGMVGTLTVQ